MSPRKVLVPLAPGFEEIEATTIIDVLRRAGVEVTVAGTESGPIEGSRGIRIVPDVALDEVPLDELEAQDMIALPGGGPGTQELRKNPGVLGAIKTFHAGGKFTAAICAAPTVLSSAGLAAGRRMTGHPAVREELRSAGVDVEPNERVVVDGTIVTSQGPGTSFEFAFKLVELLYGKEEGATKVEELNAGILART